MVSYLKKAPLKNDNFRYRIMPKEPPEGNGDGPGKVIELFPKRPDVTTEGRAAESPIDPNRELVKKRGVELEVVDKRRMEAIREDLREDALLAEHSKELHDQLVLDEETMSAIEKVNKRREGPLYGLYKWWNRVKGKPPVNVELAQHLIERAGGIFLDEVNALYDPTAEYKPIKPTDLTHVGAYLNDGFRGELGRSERKPMEGWGTNPYAWDNRHQDDEVVDNLNNSVKIIGNKLGGCIERVAQGEISFVGEILFLIRYSARGKMLFKDIDFLNEIAIPLRNKPEHKDEIKDLDDRLARYNIFYIGPERLYQRRTK